MSPRKRESAPAGAQMPKQTWLVADKSGHSKAQLPCAHPFRLARLGTCEGFRNGWRRS